MTQQNPNPSPDDHHAPPGSMRGKIKHPKPYLILERMKRYDWKRECMADNWGPWRIHGRYRTARQRDDAFDNYQRKYGQTLKKFFVYELQKVDP